MSESILKKLRDQRLSSLDVYKLVQEYGDTLVGAYIANIYQSGRRIILKLRGKEIQRRFLVFDPGIRVNLSDRLYEWEHTGLVQALRRHLRNKKIVSIDQHAFDRILLVRFHNNYEIVCEIMPRGFFVLVRDGKILAADRYDVMRDRAILPKKEYKFPPNPPKSILEMSFDEFKNVICNAKTIFNGLQKLGLGPKYALEICERSKIDKDRDINDITIRLEEIKQLFDCVTDFVKEVILSRDAYVYFSGKKPCFFAPTKLVIGEGLEIKKFECFDDVVDFYFEEVHHDLSTDEAEKIKQITEYKKKLIKIMKHQQEAIKGLSEKIEKARELVNILYENYQEIEKIFSIIRKAKDERGLEWGEIKFLIKEAKKQGAAGVQIIDEIHDDGTIVLRIGQHRISANFRESVNDIARRIYQRIKRMEEKIKGAIIALNETKEKIKELDQKMLQIDTGDKVSIFEPERKWYHGFRWFFTSNGFLTVAGRDAQTNEVLLRKYMGKDDIVLHAEIPGGAVVLIKDARNKAKETDIMEAAIYAASYSKAWSIGLSGVDVFMTFPENISLSPPSGMYLKKGAFIVKKKEIIKNVPLEIAIGIKVYEKNNAFGALITSCPIKTAMIQTDKYILIRPGKKNKNEIAKEIRKKLVEWLLEKKLKKPNRWIAEKIISLEKIVDLIPGASEIVVD